MRLGTKSVLYGAHCFFIHPWFVLAAWWRLYGAPRDPRLLIAFALHDLGYWSKPNMDGPEGETHPLWAAEKMACWFGSEWGDFCLLHSRFYAKRLRRPYSRLCVADKLAVALEPWWLYLPRVILTGEIHEYMDLARARTEAGEPKVPGKYASMNIVIDSGIRRWHSDMVAYLRAWVAEHQDGRTDTWTPTMSLMPAMPQERAQAQAEERSA